MDSLNIDGGIYSNPEEVGVSRSGLEEVINVLKRQTKDKLHTGAQLHISREGKIVLNVAIGEARPGVPMLRNSILQIFSSCKPWTALAIAQLYEKGKLDLQQTIKSIIPEFGNGKETCTIEHILIHEGGFPMLDYNELVVNDWNQIIKDICNEQANYIPGTQCGYHRNSGWMILAEIIRRIDGRTIEKYLQEELFNPLKMKDSSIGMPKELYENLGNRLAFKDAEPGYIQWSGVDNLGGNKPHPLLVLGGDGYSTATDMGILYNALWNGGESLDGVRILKKRTVDLFTKTHRMGITDQILSLPKLGELDLRPPYGYGFFKGISCGMACSENTFGHGGLRTCKNFCDPDLNGLVVNFNSNTLLNELPHFNRHNEVITAIYEACRYKF
jgi:CubicO group peptidase (beta-lactamase class C family)